MPVAKIQEEFGCRWRPALLAYFGRRVGDHAEAEDLTQELLVKLVQLERPDIVSQEAYIFQMASNLLADRARRLSVRAKYRALIERAEDHGIDRLDPLRIAVGRSQLCTISRAIAQLPERTRDIFILYRLENYGQDDIAEAFGISVSAVKKHVAKAMVTLVKTVGDEK